MFNNRGVQGLAVTVAAGVGYGVSEALNKGFRDSTVCPPCNVTNVTGTMFNVNNGTPPSPNPDGNCMSPQNFTRLMVTAALATTLAIYFLYLLFSKCCTSQKQGYEKIENEPTSQPRHSV